MRKKGGALGPAKSCALCGYAVAVVSVDSK